MSAGGTLIDWLISQELSASVRFVLNGAFNERKCSNDILIVGFDFNCGCCSRFRKRSG